MLPKSLQIITASNDDWPSMAATTINRAISKSLLQNPVCNLMLTGGSTAKRLYEEWSTSSSLPVDQIHFFFGDERCVSPESNDSNFSLVMRSLFFGKYSSTAVINRMEGENTNRHAAAKKYGALLPKQIDVLILGMGLDGHIASLAPGHYALEERKLSVMAVTGLVGLKHDRITITPKVIGEAKNVFLLATGAEKGKLLARIMASPIDFKALPIQLTFNGTWLLDADAEREILNCHNLGQKI
jgi:6-phosphogluconolactonase